MTEKPAIPVCPGSRGFSDETPPVPKLGKALGKLVQVDKPRRPLGIHFCGGKGHGEKKLEKNNNNLEKNNKPEKRMI